MPDIQVGTMVSKTNDVTMVGVVREIIFDEQLNRRLARVRFGSGTETVLLENLCLFDDGEQDMWAALSSLKVAGALPFRNWMTLFRLKSPPSPITSAFGTARVRFYPYQFKPLLKFLENPSQRLLIADDVGLGKTIEAGYILREWRARHGMQNVLIVVPARLTKKWQRELEQRFDERFEIVNGKTVVEVLERVAKGKDLPDFFWIASYETLRSQAVINAIREVRPSLDLLILDEAHRVRNRSTNQYRCADALKDCADAMLYLSATPVQTGMDNLYTLIGLLMPDTFQSRQIFDEVVRANQPIITACKLVNSGQLKQAAAALEKIKQYAVSAHLSNDPYFLEIQERLSTADPEDRATIVRLQRDISEFSLLGHLLSRTRKTEVMENWPIRQAQNPLIELSENEKAIYAAVKAITLLLNPGIGGWGAAMARTTAYRYTASCIPAAVEYFRERLAGKGLLPTRGEAAAEEDAETFEDNDNGHANGGKNSGVSPTVGQILQEILDLCPTPATDSKYQALRTTIREIWDDDAAADRDRRKIVLFSYFKRTLRYLAKQLEHEGIKTHVIHGDVDMEERLDRIEDFLENPDVNILLSSEVGGEGIDLQKASVVVNYDLPWNPMVVEQRIGRIDRIGQKANRLVIVNLVAEGTIEKRILMRLFHRIGLFRNSIGELDEIIGPLDIQKLMIDALRGELSEEQMALQVEQTAKAIEEKIVGAQTLTREADGLLAADQAFLDEINALVAKRRVPDQGDLHDMFFGLLEKKFSGIDYQPGTSRRPGKLTLGRDLLQDMANWGRVFSLEAHRVAQRFFQFGTVPVTFDPEIAMEHPRAEFIQARHPLIQYAINLLEKEQSNHASAFALRIVNPELPPGLWVLGVWSLALQSTRPETRLESIACHLETNQVLNGEQADAILVHCLSECRDLDRHVLSLPAEKITRCRDLIFEAYSQRRNWLIKENRALEERKLARLRSTWVQTLTIRRDAAQKRLDGLIAKDAKEFAIKMARSALEKRDRSLKAKMEELSAIAELGWEEKEVSALIVEISP